MDKKDNLSNRLKLEGVHGTSQESASEIKKGGFLPFEGIQGKGVYFWKKDGFAKELAIGWMKHKMKGIQKPPPCSIIYASLLLEENEYIDLTNPSFRNKLVLYVKKMTEEWERKTDKGNVDEFYAKGFNLLFGNLEKEHSYIVKVVGTQVAPPPNKYCSYPRNLLGYPFTYIVREVDCIEVDSVEIENIKD